MPLGIRMPLGIACIAKNKNRIPLMSRGKSRISFYRGELWKKQKS